MTSRQKRRLTLCLLLGAKAEATGMMFGSAIACVACHQE